MIFWILQTKKRTHEKSISTTFELYSKIIVTAFKFPTKSESSVDFPFYLQPSILFEIWKLLFSNFITKFSIFWSNKSYLALLKKLGKSIDSPKHFDPLSSSHQTQLLNNQIRKFCSLFQDCFIVPTFDSKVTEYLCSGWVFFLRTNFGFLTSHF